ncbi:MAG TPA: pepsin/retropepsin-like aspartic protease family protein [Rhizomicrobium sp.]|nr:pepsin/retropepsin-like aspartic protease family protein [Rhizomicrobium sp.]
MRLVLAAASLSMVLTGAAHAADCVPPQLLNSVPITLAHGGGMPIVSASIDESPVKFLVDTGSIVSQVSYAPAAALRLTSLATPRGQYDISGRFSREAARITTFVLGNMQATGFYLRLVPDPDFSAEPPFDGILATDMMSRYDIDLDFGHRRLNYFAPEACQNAGIYWAPKALSMLPTPTLPGRAYVDVVLDGHKISALIDTGSEHSMMNPVLARNLFGLTPGSPDMTPGEIISDGATAKADFHTFPVLSLGELTLTNVPVAVVRDARTEDNGEYHISRTLRTQFDLHQLLPDLTLGMDVLRQTHLYISFRNQRIYVSRADDGAAQPPAMSEPNKLTVWHFGYEMLHPFIVY